MGVIFATWEDDFSPGMMTPEKVEYLFGLGQMKFIGKPGSEYGGESWYYTHDRDGIMGTI